MNDPLLIYKAYFEPSQLQSFMTCKQLLTKIGLIMYFHYPYTMHISFPPRCIVYQDSGTYFILIFLNFLMIALKYVTFYKWSDKTEYYVILPFFRICWLTDWRKRLYLINNKYLFMDFFICNRYFHSCCSLIAYSVWWVGGHWILIVLIWFFFVDQIWRWISYQ